MKTDATRDGESDLRVEVQVSEMLTLEEDNELVYIPERKLLQYWAQHSFIGADTVEVSMKIVEIDEMRVMNRDFRNKDKTTNVLSFPMEIPGDVNAQTGVNILGDIVLCAQVIKQEAIEQSKTLDNHWAHMVVHGMLHLQGFDHMKDNDAQEMESLEVRMLNRIGVADPYELQQNQKLS